jgi:cytidylate kinase
MRVVAIGGMPGTGKTRVMRDLIFCLNKKHVFDGAFKTFKYKHYQDQNVIVGGIYDGQVNDGTDRLSMAVMPDAKGFVEKHIDGNFTLVFEGDRLYTKNFLAWLTTKISDYRFLMLFASIDVRAKRYEQRGTNQSPSFIKGRATKCENIMYAQSFFVETLQNNDEVDVAIIVSSILNYINGVN